MINLDESLTIWPHIAVSVWFTLNTLRAIANFVSIIPENRSYTFSNLKFMEGFNIKDVTKSIFLIN